MPWSVRSITLCPEIGLRSLFGEQQLLSGLDRPHDRRGPVIGAEDAHSKVDLGSPGIIPVHRDQAKKRVGGLSMERSERIRPRGRVLDQQYGGHEAFLERA